MIRLLLATLFMSNAYAMEFNTGQTYRMAQLSGGIVVQCDNGMNRDVKMSACHKKALFPRGPHKIINNDPSVTKVKITVITSEGKKRTKSVRINKKSGESKEIDLVSNSLIKRSLFTAGLNQVTLSAYAGRKLVQTENFEVEIEDMGRVMCGSGQFISKSMTDCYSPAKFCEMMFENTGCLGK